MWDHGPFIMRGIFRKWRNKQTNKCESTPPPLKDICMQYCSGGAGYLLGVHTRRWLVVTGSDCRGGTPPGYIYARSTCKGGGSYTKTLFISTVHLLKCSTRAVTSTESLLNSSQGWLVSCSHLYLSNLQLQPFVRHSSCSQKSFFSLYLTNIFNVCSKIRQKIPLKSY